jgi:tetratricopeptide (TPR) repeat protein
LGRKRHCIVAILALAIWTGAHAQGSRPLSLRDAQAWQQLQGESDQAAAKGDFAGAADLATRALAAGAAGFGPEDPNVASTLSALGAVQLRLGNVAGAEQSFRRALAIYEKRFGPEHEFVGALLNNLGLVVERRGDLAGAELLLRRSLAIKEKTQGPGHPDTGVTLANLARVLDRQGKSGQLAAGTAAPAARAPASTDEGTRLASQAQGAAGQGDFPQAESLHRQALAIHEGRLGPEHPTTLATLTNLGNVMLLQGKSREAEQVFRRVLTAREKVLGPEHPDTAVSLNNLANALFEQSRQDDVTAFTGRRLRGGNDTLLASQASETETLYRRALAIQERQGAGAASAATLNNLAVLLAGRGRFDEAIELHRRALASAEKALGPRHLDTASMLTTLAITYDRQGRLAEAEAAFNRAVAIARESGVARNLLVNAGALAQSLARRGRLREALPYYREAADALDVLYAQTRGQGESARAAFLGRYAYVYRELIRILAVLHAQAPAAGHDREALAVASRGQSRVFSEMLRQADVARFSSDAAFEAVKRERDALIDRVNALRIAQLSVPEAQAGAQDVRESLARDLAAAQRGLAEADARMWRDYPRYMDLANPRPVTADDLQQRLLKEGEALLTFASLNGETVIFAVTRDKLSMAMSRVGREEVARRVDLVRRPMERIARGDPLVVLRQTDPAVLAGLWRDLVAPVAGILAGASRVMVVADGALYALPLELLVTRWGDAERAKFDAARAATDGSAGRPFLAEYETLPFAGQSMRFSYLPSLAALASQRGASRPVASHARRLVGFADAVFGPDDDGAAYGERTRTVLGALAGGGDGAPRIPRLPETAQEVREVAQVLGEPSAVFLRREAQEKRVKSGILKDARYVLFATHGFLGADFVQGMDLGGDGESRARAGALAQPALALTLTGDLEGEDGLLSMREVIEDIEMTADLVVLSACNTAGETSAGANGEGFAGLTRAFMYAGARRLMVSHWSVESTATQALVSGTFRELANGRDAVEGLAVARGSLASGRFEAGGRHYARAHPFFWAPFVMVGD